MDKKCLQPATRVAARDYWKAFLEQEMAFRGQSEAFGVLGLMRRYVTFCTTI